MLKSISVTSNISLPKIDVKPNSNPSCFNNDGNGIIPVAIFGSSMFDVTQIDFTTVKLESLPIKVKGNMLPQFSFKNVNQFDEFGNLIINRFDGDKI